MILSNICLPKNCLYPFEIVLLTIPKKKALIETNENIHIFVINIFYVQTEVKVEASAVKQLLEESIGVEEGDEVSLLQAGHPPIMIRGEDGVLYQVQY